MIYDSGGEHLMKKIKVTAAVLIAVLIGGISVSAAPSDSFFRIYEPDGTATSVISREMFTVFDVITATSLGIEKSMTGLTDVCFSDNGDIYILCGGDSRIIVLNPDYSFKKELKLEYNGEALDCINRTLNMVCDYYPAILFKKIIKDKIDKKNNSN